MGNFASYQERRLTLRYGTKKSICLDIALRLTALHNNEICHGDVKSEDVLLFSHAKKGIIAKLGDFGFSFANSHATDLERKVKLPVETLPWNASEHREEALVMMLKYTDIYSYGLML